MIELLVAFGLASILLPALLTGFVGATQGREVYEQRIAATALVREAEEAIRSVRNDSWNNISILSTDPTDNKNIYYPAISGTKWALSPGSEPINGFTRTIAVSDVYRDASQNIVTQDSPGAILDPSTRQFLITVSWPGYFRRSITSSLYITRYGNTSLSETQTVSAPAGGFGDWCKPTQSLTSVDLSRQGIPTSVLASVSIGGTGNRVFAGTGGNASGPTFTNTKITGNAPSITATSLGDYNNTKANGIFGDSNYAYIATDSNSEEVTILDLNQYSNPPTNTLYKKVGALDTPGPADADSVYVVGNTGYVTTSDNNNKTLYTFDVSDKASPHISGSVSLPGRGIKMTVIGTYAYIAISGSNTKMQIVDVLDPSSPILVGSYVNTNLPDGRDVFVNGGGSRAYLVTAASTTQPEFFILDISNKASPNLINGGTYDTNGMDPYGVTIVPGLRAIVVGHDGNEYQVFVITNDTISPCPNQDSFLNIDSGVNAISSILQPDDYAYSYIVTGDSNAELKIIEGGLGGGGAGGNGTYESPTLPVPDPGHDVAFNSFTATNDPSLSYKISIKHGVSGSCSLVTFSDSDFTAFVPGSLPLTIIGSGYVNPGECLRYRAINSGSSPITFTATFNYSP